MGKTIIVEMPISEIASSFPNSTILYSDENSCRISYPYSSKSGMKPFVKYQGKITVVVNRMDDNRCSLSYSLQGAHMFFFFLVILGVILALLVLLALTGKTNWNFALMAFLFSLFLMIEPIGNLLSMKEAVDKICNAITTRPKL